MADIEPVRAAFAKTNNQFKRKKPVNKISSDCYRFVIGKLGQGVVKSPSDGADILDRLISAALDDTDIEFRARIKQAYGLDAVVPEATQSEDEKPRKRKPTGQAPDVEMAVQTQAPDVEMAVEPLPAPL